MQVDFTFHNNISHKGFKSDYKVLCRQFSKAKFMMSNCQTEENYKALQNASKCFKTFCDKNPIRTSLLKFKESFNIPKKNLSTQYKNHLINIIEKDMLSKREHMTVDIGDEKISIRDFNTKFFKEKDLSKKEKMHKALSKSQEPLQGKLEELITQRNKFAQKKGFKNYYEFILKERFDMNPGEVDELIKDFSSKKGVIESTKKRKELLAKFWNINVEELKSHHYDILTNLYSFNNYIESPEQLINLTKTAYQNMGFDIKRFEDENRIFYDLLPKEGKSIFISFCRTIPEADAVGLCLNVETDINSLRVLLHEFGHAMYRLNTSDLLSKRSKNPIDVYNEAVAIMFENLAVKEDLLKGIIPEDKYMFFKQINEIERDILLTSVCVNTEFEKEIYENPHQDFKKLKSKLNKKYNLNEDAPSWYFDQLVTHPARSAVYLKAILLSNRIYEAFSKTLGGGFLNNTETAKVLRENIFRYGKYMSDKKLNNKLDKLI